MTIEEELEKKVSRAMLEISVEFCDVEPGSPEFSALCDYRILTGLLGRYSPRDAIVFIQEGIITRKGEQNSEYMTAARYLDQKIRIECLGNDGQSRTALNRVISELNTVINKLSPLASGSPS